MRGLVAGFVVLLLLPVVAGQTDPGPAEAAAPQASTPTTLYAHVLGVQDMPLNTQAPADPYSDWGGYGLAFTLTCLDPVTGDIAGTGTGTQGTTGQRFATAYGYSAPNRVEYGKRDADGHPRTHPERGLASDVRLDPAVPVVLTWYVAAGAHVVGPTGQAVAGTVEPIPEVQLRATLRTGDDVSIADEAYDAGELLMRGTSPTVTLVGDEVIAGPDGADGVTALGQHEGRYVYEVRVPMAVESWTLPGERGFNLRIDLYSSAPTCDPDANPFLPSTLAAYTAPGLRPRLEFAVLQPFETLYAVPAWDGDDLELRVSIDSAWGKYDLDVDAMRFDTQGPGETHFILQDPDVGGVRLYPVSTQPLDLVWVWEGARQEAANGHYDVAIDVPNLQGTATHEVRFSFDKQPAAEAAGLAPVWLAAALVALAALAARRP